MLRDDLLKAFAGAAIALILSEGIRFIARWNSKVKQRKILSNYLKSIIKPGLTKYLQDLEKADIYIKSFLTDNHTGYGTYDTLPSLNSDIIKNIGFNGLYTLTGDFKTHSQLIDLYHVLDYLKEFTPFQAVREFEKYCQDHLNTKGILEMDLAKAHALECGTIRQAKKRSINSLELRKRTVLEVIPITDGLIKSVRNFKF